MLLAALLLIQSAPACAATDAALPPALAGWAAPGEAFAPGKSVKLEAGDAAKVVGLRVSARLGRAATISFRIAEAGTYGIALDQPGWIDILPGAECGAALASVAHGHGPQCSTIRKIVRFRLEPGLYRLYLSGLIKPVARVMLVTGAQ